MMQFKFFYLIIFLSMFFLSCSSKKVRSKSVIKNDSLVIYTASSNSKDFVYKKFRNIRKNQKNYLIDIDGDNVDELITLQDSFSEPKFYAKNTSGDDYILLSKKGQGFRSSFLKLDSIRSNSTNVLGMVTFFQNDFMPPSGISYYQVKKSDNVIKLDLLDKVNRDKKLPTSAVEQIDIQFQDKPMSFYFHWLMNTDGTFRPVVDQILIDKKMKNLTFELKERANYSSSTCDLNNDNDIEIILSSTSDDPVEYIDYNPKKNIFFKGSVFKNSDSAIFTSCYYKPFKSNPYFIIGRLHRDYDYLKKPSGLFDREGEQIFNFDLPKNSQVANVITTDLNSDIYPDFIVENNGHPPETKLEVFISDGTGAYIKDTGVNVINPSGVVAGDFDNDGRVDIYFGRSTKRAPNIQSEGGVLINKILAGNNKSIRLYFEGFKKFKDAEGGVVKVITENGPIKRIIRYSSGGLPSQSSRFIQIGLGKSLPEKIELYLKGKKFTYQLPALGAGTNILTICGGEEVKVGRYKCNR